MAIYNPIPIEEKWLEYWESQKLFQGTARHFGAATSALEKFYALFAFAYPSGSGLHVGHVESKTALDILVRFYRMTGKDVFFPVGWDAFGLPAENYAIKTGIHPSETTKSAITTFRRQIKRLGISYDWETELATCHPAYYKWTQWIFVQLFKKGLAYRDIGWVNWCPQDKTVLANEQVVNGECERCGAKVVQKELEQWKFKITAYQDELLSGLDQVDWPKATKTQQENWIGKSKGLSIDFALQEVQTHLTVWTKFWETVFGVTFVVIAPEKFKDMNLLESVPAEKKAQVEAYLDAAFHKTEEQRRIGEKDKSGVDTGLTLRNPVNGQFVPLWIADYVLMNVGTGVVMGVPSHDERDFAFAKKYALPLIQVVSYENEETNTAVAQGKASHEGEGVLINSGKFDGLPAWGEGKSQMAEWMIEEGYAKWQTTYKLRDWLISRQRYWGAPIPMVHCPDCGWQSIPEDQLPVALPELEDFTPTDDGKSPIEKASNEWKYTECPQCKGKAKREVDTMDTFVDSSWYFLRYAARNEEKMIFDKDTTQKLLPVDLYLIGPEHIVLHLLYARFFTKFLRDEGYLAFDEPFLKMRHQGMILGPDGKKMSKSKGNVINPDEIIEKFGSDTLRMYEMFMGPLDADKAWDMSGVAGVYRFISKVYSLFTSNIAQLEGKNNGNEQHRESLRKKLHWAINKLTLDIEQLKFNTSIAALMEFTNVWTSSLEAKILLTKEELSIVARLMAPLAPFVAEELWTMVSSDSGSVHLQQWPTADQRLLTESNLEIVIQINGKVKTKIVLPMEKAQETEVLKAQVLSSESVLALIGEKKVKNIVIIPGKLANIVM